MENFNLRQQILKVSSGSFGIQIIFTGLSFVTSILLTRILGASGYGSYIYALSWKSLVGFIAIFGFDQFLIKEIAVLHSKEKWNEMNGLLRFSNQITVLISISIFLIATISFWFFFGRKDLENFFLFSIVFASLIPRTLGSLRSATLSGLNLVLIGQLPEYILFHITFIPLIGLAYLINGGSISLLVVTSLWFITNFVMFVFGSLLLLRNIPDPARKAEPEYKKARTWIASAFPFIFISAMNIVLNQTDIIMLGTLTDSTQVGVYAVSTRISQFVAFVLMAMNRALGPNIARLYANNQKERLQSIITKTTRLVTVAALPLVIGFIFWGNTLLSIFGEEFVEGYLVLVILSLGQLVNVATGSVGLLLNMTGNQKEVAFGIALSATLNIVLNLILIPKYGMVGAAIATMASMVIQNVHLMFVVTKKLGIKSSILG